MSSITHLEKRTFEELLGMGSGYVLYPYFSDRLYKEFFRDIVGLNIYDDKYSTYGISKAKRLRRFWELESDAIVGKLLDELLKIWLHNVQDQKAAKGDRNYLACQNAVSRLLCKPTRTEETEEDFLEKDFSKISVHKLKVEASLIFILEKRIKEINLCLKSSSSLAAVIMTGSVMEGILLGAALSNPQKFNQSSASPKDTSGKVLPFQNWTLSNFIDAACDAGFLKPDIKKFSHAVRDFRNYIHPYEQMAANFAPDQHTAKICLQVLKAAIADLSGER